MISRPENRASLLNAWPHARFAARAGAILIAIGAVARPGIACEIDPLAEDPIVSQSLLGPLAFVAETLTMAVPLIAQAAQGKPEDCEPKPVTGASTREMLGGASAHLWISAPTPAKSRGTIVIYPTIIGASFLERGFAASLCHEGYSVIINEYVRESESAERAAIAHPDLEKNEIKEVLRGSGNLFAWLRAHPKEFGGKIGLFGMSLGGIFASTVATNYPNEVAGATFVAAGEDVARIFATSQKENLVAVREGIKRAYHLETDEAYYAFMHAIDREIDLPTPRAPPDPKKYLMFLADSDTSVPTATQYRLWRSLGKPGMYHYRTRDHVAAIVSTYLFQRPKVLEFFRERLGDDAT